jgi:hypothetical protein
MSTDSSNWGKEIEELLDQIRKNSNILEDYHKNKYFAVKKTSVYYKLPVIVLSSVNGLIAVSLNQYINQNLVSGINAGISFIISTLSSIALYLKIEDKAEQELEASKKYHKLSINIFKVLSLKADTRGCDGDIFLQSCFSEYLQLFEKSGLTDIEFSDKLKIDLHVGISVKE